VVFVELVVEGVRVREVDVQRLDDLFGLLRFEPECVLFDGAGALSRFLLRAHTTLPRTLPIYL